MIRGEYQIESQSGYVTNRMRFQTAHYDENGTPHGIELVFGRKASSLPVMATTAVDVTVEHLKAIYRLPDNQSYSDFVDDGHTCIFTWERQGCDVHLIATSERGFEYHLPFMFVQVQGACRAALQWMGVDVDG